MYFFLSRFFIALIQSIFLQPPSSASSAKASRVPEVGGGPSTSIFVSGSDASTSLHFMYGLGTRVSPPFGSGTSFASARKICLREIETGSDIREFANTIPS